MKKLTKEQLKTAVNEVAPKLGEDVVFVAALRAIKDKQIEIEFVQSRSLAGRRVSLLALANEGDKRFNTGKNTMRAWMMFNEEGFKSLFGNIEGFDFAKAKELALTATADERIGIFAQAKTINVGTKEQPNNQPLKIVCKETTDVDQLPKSIKDQILDSNVSQDIKDRYILQTGPQANGNESVRIVDQYGNTVYRRYELSYGTDTDVLVEGKVLATELNNSTKTSTNDVLKSALVS